MQVFRKTQARRAAWIIASALIPTSQAALLQNVAGQNYNYDKKTQLAWLDITETTYLSFDDIIGGHGGFIEEGWRFATEPEVTALLKDNLQSFKTSRYNDPHIYKGAYYAPSQRDSNGELRRLVRVLGGPIPQPDADPGTWFATYNRDAVEAGPGLKNIVYFDLHRGIGSVAPYYASTINFGYTDQSNFLVRQMAPGSVPPIPEPATAALWLAGLGLLLTVKKYKS
ncbi:PEP-CTERM sorting domain-containing protein [Azohydromonas australica]|uniref:PEP-CTERM sorting domain-containing protein n=1 Tax=Azohydromonas australica TaxID=364039 RepID=UPI0012EBCFAC|nr:PEP-CTERM sorting domain-containing protein [Azohydromonas australica]